MVSCDCCSPHFLSVNLHETSVDVRNPVAGFSVSAEQVSPFPEMVFLKPSYAFESMGPYN